MSIRFISFAFAISSLFMSLAVQCQESLAPVSRTYYIKNCNLVPRPGVLLPNQNVLIRNGIIVETGPAVKPPYDAQLLIADSLYVYAGFIDGSSYTGIPKQEAKDRPKGVIPGSPPNEVAGITPEVQVADIFSSSDKSVADMRNIGLTVTHAMPRGLMLPGQSAVFLLGEGSPDKLLLSRSAAQVFQFETQRGVYPSTLIGVTAKFRDIYKNASLAGTHEAKFQSVTTLNERPDYRREWMAFYPVTTGKQPLYVTASKSKDVHRALSLQQELGFRLVLTEVKQGWHYIQEIKKGGYGLLLSLDLPEEEKKDTKKEEGKSAPADGSPEKAQFDMKRDSSLAEYVKQAAMFEKAGVDFGFSFISSKSGDMRKSVSRMIKAGLTETAALRALTTYPAGLLGLSRILGTVEKGKIANLVLTDGPVFQEKSKIRYVFVEGRKFSMEQPVVKSEKKEEQKTSIEGKWSYTVDVGGDTRKGILEIGKKEGEYQVTVSTDAPEQLTEKAANIVYSDGKLTFTVVTQLEQVGKVDFELRFSETTYTGTLTIAAFGSFPVKGDKLTDPK